MSKISMQEVKKSLTMEQVQELREWGEVTTDSGYIESLFIEGGSYEWTEVVTFDKAQGFSRVYRVEELSLEADTFETLEVKVGSLEHAWACEAMEQRNMRFW